MLCCAACSGAAERANAPRCSMTVCASTSILAVCSAVAPHRAHSCSIKSQGTAVLYDCVCIYHHPRLRAVRWRRIESEDMVVQECITCTGRIALTDLEKRYIALEGADWADLRGMGSGVTFGQREPGPPQKPGPLAASGEIDEDDIVRTRPLVTLRKRKFVVSPGLT